MNTSRRAELVLFAAASFAAAFLIFLVQPIVGKRILPWFGGVPAVWALCLAFFQTALFAGYAYAHALVRWVPPRAQLAVHAAPFAAALALLPVLPGDAWKPDGGGGAPIPAILAMLVAVVALPFLALAATGPLVQAWFARRHPGRSPYPLYAVSNLGSLAALLGYPFAIEPHVGLAASGRAWSWAFAATAAAVLGCALLAHRAAPAASAAAPAAGPGPAPARRALWIALAGAAVVLLMGITNALCTDTASVPFLWILPLATYLATFILCFAYPALYVRPVFAALAAVAYALPWLVDVVGASPPGGLRFEITRQCLLLFAACMVLHGELYRLRPDPAHLTAYYLSVSLGGALGGLFVGVAAPLVFPGTWELGLGLAAAWALLLVVCRADPESWLFRGAPRWRAALAGVATLALVAVGARDLGPEPGLLFQERTFFGVLRVREVGADAARRFSLTHGTTLHGFQYPTRPRMPTSYYGPRTGIGLTLGARPLVATRVGVIGLGVGTLAAYGRPGDHFRFYEIDPAVIRIASSGAYFQYLSTSAAEIAVVEGDARLSLEAERARGLPPLDWLIVDAYSSDALPVHLLTREALALYADSLAPDGVLAMHVSSQHFDLPPLLGRLALDVGLRMLVITSPRLPRVARVRSQWAFLARDPERLDALRETAEAEIAPLGLPDGAYRIEAPPLESYAEAPLWTDDYSDLLGVLRR